MKNLIVLVLLFFVTVVLHGQNDSLKTTFFILAKNNAFISAAQSCDNCDELVKQEYESAKERQGKVPVVNSTQELLKARGGSLRDGVDELEWSGTIEECEKKVLVNEMVGNEVYKLTQDILGVLPARHSKKIEGIENIFLFETFSKDYKKTAAIAYVKGLGVSMIYDPEIFQDWFTMSWCENSSNPRKQRELFKYLIIAHEVSHIIQEHVYNCFDDHALEEVKAAENSADFLCGKILAWLGEYTYQELRRLLEDEECTLFLKSKFNNNISHRKGTIKSGFYQSKPAQVNRR